MVTNNNAGFLTIDRVTKRFGGLLALSDVSFSIQQGEIVGLIGPNGAGKTTLFNILSGAVKPSSGQVLFQGVGIAQRRYDQVCRLGLVRTHQIPRPFRSLTVWENVRIGAGFGARSPCAIQECVEQALEQSGLAPKSKRLASELTGAELKALEVARALAAKPVVLLLDEAIAGLNMAEADRMVELIRRLNQSGTTIVMVEHVMKVVMGVCDRIVMLQHGLKIADGLPDQIATDPVAIKAYFRAGAPAGALP